MTRLEKLKDLEQMLLDMLQEGDPKASAALAKQYRETIREIEEIEGSDGESDEIEKLLQNRDANGKAGAVRKDRSKV